MKRRRPTGRALALAAAGLLGACASTPPTHFYTLVPPAVPDGASAAAPATFAIDVRAVAIPAAVDMPQFVLRQSGGEVAVVEDRQWIGPLAEEIRAAVSDQLVRRLGATDIHRQGGTPGAQPVIRIGLDVTRFESVLGQQVVQDVSWRLSRDRDAAVLRCVSRLALAVGPGYEALAEGHQQLVGRLAEQLAWTLSQSPPACPAAPPTGGAGKMGG